MLRAAIVEDEPVYAQLLESYFTRWCADKGITGSVSVFTNPILFLDPYRAEYQVVFMDIQMPHMNGMEVARKLRALDANVLLIFVTSLAQYAIQGYEVRAFDYVLKPLSYPDFMMKMSRVEHQMRMDTDEPETIISDANGKVKLVLKDILYIESEGHHLIYHTLGDKTYSVYARMNDAEKQYASHHFARCNSCYLVNLRYVRRVKGYTVSLEGVDLQISQPRKKEFMQSFLSYTEERIR